MTKFTEKDRKELLDRLKTLRQVCYPASKLLVPEFNFKRKKDFDSCDFLDCGYPIPPSELKDLWQDRKTLQDHNVDYVIVKGKKWFYNTKQIITDFYSQDGNQKVEVRFPFWMDGENIWRHSEHIDAMKKVLEKCSGQHFPTQKEAAACFSKKLLRRIHDKNPSRPAIEDAVLEMVETLRKKCKTYLRQYHFNDIVSDPNFITFVHNTPLPINTPDQQKVKVYLDKNTQAVYFLAQKFGLIQNAASLMYYEKMRDHPRHPEKIAPLSIDPRKNYRDFEKVLGVSTKGASRAKTLKVFDENSDIVQHLDDMSCIFDILDQYVDPKLKDKKRKAIYYQDLIQKKILTRQEARLISQKRIECNDAAHLNNPVRQARKRVLEDTDLTSILHKLFEKDRKKQQQRRHWIDASDYTH